MAKAVEDILEGVAAKIRLTPIDVEMTIYASKVADKKGSEIPSPEVVTDYTVSGSRLPPMHFEINAV